MHKLPKICKHWQTLLLLFLFWQTCAVKQLFKAVFCLEEKFAVCFVLGLFKIASRPFKLCKQYSFMSIIVAGFLNGNRAILLTGFDLFVIKYYNYWFQRDNCFTKFVFAVFYYCNIVNNTKKHFYNGLIIFNNKFNYFIVKNTTYGIICFWCKCNGIFYNWHHLFILRIEIYKNIEMHLDDYFDAIYIVYVNLSYLFVWFYYRW